MTLQKAIEIVTLISYGDTLTIKYDIEDAIKLCLQSAKRIEFYRRDKCHVANIKLPGETDE